jgi:hypothetical protein
MIPKLLCWAYIALFCNSLMMEPLIPKHVVVLIIAVNCVLFDEVIGAHMYDMWVIGAHM